MEQEHLRHRRILSMWATHGGNYAQPHRPPASLMDNNIMLPSAHYATHTRPLILKGGRTSTARYLQLQLLFLSLPAT